MTLLRWKTTRPVTLLIVTLTLGATGPGALSQADGPAATFTSRANLVLVPVVVEEGSGKHVFGLTKGDFDIIENGKSKPITVFEEVKTTSKRMRRAPSQRGVYTNMVSSDDSPKRLTIFALDTLNTPFLDQSFAREQLIKFLARRIDSQEPSALVSIQGNGVRILHDFSSDPAVLVAALKKATGETPGLTFSGQQLEETRSRELSTGQQRAAAASIQGGDPYGPSLEEFETQTAAIDSFVKGSDLSYAVSAQKASILTTLESFQHVAEAFAGVPGRKSLIWITAAFPFGLDPTTGTLLAPRVFNQGQAVDQNTQTSSGALPELP
jgi:VWFA-related protein